MRLHARIANKLTCLQSAPDIDAHATAGVRCAINWNKIQSESESKRQRNVLNMHFSEKIVYSCASIDTDNLIEMCVEYMK